MTKREVRKWLQMTTRRDVKVARQAKQHLVAKQESARAEASSARAAVEAAKNGLWVMQNSKYSRSVKKLIAGVSKEGKKQLSFFERSFATTKLKVGGGSKKKKVRMCGRKLMGESRHLPSAPGPISKLAISNQDSVTDVSSLGENQAEKVGTKEEEEVEVGLWRRRRRSKTEMAAAALSTRNRQAKSGRLRGLIKKVRKSLHEALCEAIGIVKEAEKNQARVRRINVTANARVKAIKKRLKGLTKELKKFRRTKVGSWTCSRVSNVAAVC